MMEITPHRFDSFGNKSLDKYHKQGAINKASKNVIIDPLAALPLVPMLSDRHELSLGCGDPLPDQPTVGARR